MRTLIALAVMGLCSALPHQAYNSFPSSSYGTPHAGHYQPQYTGPLASTVPAGIDGKVIPVADTYEVSAARNAFFGAYQKQLAAVGAVGRYAAAPAYHHASAPVHHAAPAYHHASAPVHHAAPAYHHTPIHSHAAPSYNAVPHGQVRDTPEVEAAKSQFFHLYNQQAAAAAAAPDDYTSHHHSHHHGHHY